MTADLAIEAGDTYRPLAIYAPGETVVIPYAIRNNDADIFSGRVRVTVTLRDLSGSISEDVVGSATTGLPPVLSIASEATRFGTLALRLPSGMAAGAWSVTLSVAVTTDGNDSLPDQYLPDNTVDVGRIAVQWSFGNVTDFFGEVLRENVVLTMRDFDGTEYTVAMRGGGEGFMVFEDVNALAPTAMLLRGVSTLSGLVQQNLTVVRSTTMLTGDAFVNTDYTIRRDFGAPLLIGAFNAPQLVLGGDMELSTTAVDARTVTTLNSVASGRLLQLGDSFGVGNVGTVIMQRLDGQLRIDGNVTRVVVAPAGGTGPAMTNSAVFYVGGSITTLSVGRVDGNDVDFPTSRVSIAISGNAGDITIGDADKLSLLVDRRVTRLTMGNVSNSGIGLNPEGASRGSIGRADFGHVSDTGLLYNQQLSSLTAKSWTSTPEGFDPPAINRIGAIAITTLTIGGSSPADVANVNNGNFDAFMFITGGTSRPTQLGTVNIRGVMTGSIFVSGSVGAVTVRIVDSGTYLNPPEGALAAGIWAPALAASGSVLSFTGTDVRSGALWAGSVRTVNLTVRSNNRNFEVAAGLRLDRDSLLTLDPVTALYGDGNSVSGLDAAAFRSGTIGSLVLVLSGASPAGPVPITGFTGRFIANVNVTSDALRSSTTGLLNFAGNASSLRRAFADTASRIGSILVTGAGASVLNNNSLGFAFTTYPTAAFTFGPFAGANAVRIPVGLSNAIGPIAGITPVSVPAGIFFRVGTTV